VAAKLIESCDEAFAVMEDVLAHKSLEWFQMCFVIVWEW
jgi:hypothetical protein